jgi:hypothetical protein
MDGLRLRRLGQPLRPRWPHIVPISVLSAATMLALATWFPWALGAGGAVVLLLAVSFGARAWSLRGGPSLLTFGGALCLGWVLALVGAIIYGQPSPLLSWFDAHGQALQALTSLVGLAILAVQLRLLDAQTGISSRQQRLLEEQDQRDRANFRVATLASNPFSSLHTGQVVEVDFTVSNEGHKDSSIESAHVEVWAKHSEPGGTPITSWPVHSLQRSDGALDFMVRAGDKVRFRGNVTIPEGPLGGGYAMVARPVLYDGSNTGQAWFPPK